MHLEACVHNQLDSKSKELIYKSYSIKRQKSQLLAIQILGSIQCSDRRPPVVVDTIHHSVVLLYFIFLRVQSSRFVLYI